MTIRTLSLLLVFAGVVPAYAQQKPGGEAEQAAKRLKAPKGLQIDVFAAEPDFVNPVSFTFDEKGRAYVVETHRLGNCTFDIRGRMSWVDDDLACRTVADREAEHRKYMGAKYDQLTSSERIRLLEDRDGDGRVDHAVTFAEDFATPATGLAAGILARDGNVWFACIPDLWKLRDTDGDGKADERRVLHTGYGVRLAFIGHDLHGLRIGPDGLLYFTVGDRGVHVEQDGKVLVDNPDSGCVMRCHPDGSGLEVFATGLRNPQELAFDAYGNLWTGDNNCDAGDAARWTYLMEGGDCGWRIGYQQAPGRGPWMSEKLWGLEAAQTAPSQVPPVAHVGHGPSGICFNGGIGLPDAYKDHFFFTDFPGSVLSFGVKPKGAGFEVTDLKTFVGDVWPTDVEIGNDGAVYFSDWVNGWGMPNKGRIYRVADPALAKDARVLEAKTFIAEGMEKRGDNELATLLGHGDQRVRTAAQFELAGRKNPAVLIAAAGKGKPTLARIHALWGLGQRGELAAVAAQLGDEDAEVRAQAAKVIGDRRYAAGGDRLLPLLQDASPRVRAFAAMAIGKLGRKDAVGPLFDMLAANGDQDPWLRHAGVIALAWIGDATAVGSRAVDPARSVRLASLLALRRLRRPEVAGFLQDQDGAAAFEAARAINDEPIPAALPALAAMLGKKLPDKAWNRAVNAAYRIGDAAALGAFAKRNDVPDAARAEALKALAEWAPPSGRDRILHVWRPIPTRDGAAAAKALEGSIEGLLGSGPDPVREAAALAASTLGLREAGPALAEMSRKGGPWTRIAALKALAALKDERLAESVKAAAEDKDPNVRKEATRLLSQLHLPNGAALLVKAATEDGPVGVRQNAIASLGQMPGADAEGALSRMMDELLAGRFPAALRLDLVEAAKAKPKLQDKLRAYEAGWKKDDPIAPFRDALEGGDAEAGRKIFAEKSEVSCMKCHKVRGQGGEVGPILDTVGGHKTRDYLLESLVVPNKEIAPGFGQVVLLLKSEAVEAGRIEVETETEVRLILGDGSRKRIPKGDIQARKVGLSPMPEDLVKKLSVREIRDLVEFLASLKG